MLPHVRPTWAEIDLDALSSNIQIATKRLPEQCEVFAVVKGDAYGHGAVQVARAALKSGASRLAVSMIDEACELRSAGIAAPILVMGYTPADQGRLAADLSISLTVFDQENAYGLLKSARSSAHKLRFHLKVDTGMGRLGISPEQAVCFIEWLVALPGCEVEGIFTHFASADHQDHSYTDLQLVRFRNVIARLDQLGITIPLVHAANSSAAVRFPESHFNAVRLGLVMYGLYPSSLLKSCLPGLVPVMSVKTTVSHAKWVTTGQPVGYGGTHVTEQQQYIVTLPIGYADGYPRLLSGKAHVLLGGEHVPVVGSICMDQCLVDATKVSHAVAGDEVVIWGTQGDNQISADELAQSIGTISYELVCLVSKRVPRVYLQAGRAVEIRSLQSVPAGYRDVALG